MSSIVGFVSRQPQFSLEWTPTVTASYSFTENLPAGAAQDAMVRGVEFYRRARLLVTATWSPWPVHDCRRIEHILTACFLARSQRRQPQPNSRASAVEKEPALRTSAGPLQGAQVSSTSRRATAFWACSRVIRRMLQWMARSPGRSEFVPTAQLNPAQLCSLVASVTRKNLKPSGSFCQ